jgi:hypothetical protein
VSERWLVCREERRDDTYLVHVVDVDRRRTTQTCGRIPLETFAPRWSQLIRTGVLRPGEDLRLMPPRGTPAFAARLDARYGSGEREATARRPLATADLAAVQTIFRDLERRLLLADVREIPATVRVEVGMGSCLPPGPPRP